MIVRNKKNGTNVLNLKNGRVSIKGGETVNIPNLTDFDQVINKADFGQRGWFEIIEEAVSIEVEEKKKEKKEDTSLEKARREVREYTSEEKNKEE